MARCGSVVWVTRNGQGIGRDVPLPANVGPRKGKSLTKSLIISRGYEMGEKITKNPIREHNKYHTSRYTVRGAPLWSSSPELSHNGLM